MKTYVIGDIHGSIKALNQCLERSSFDPNVDHLILLGDLCDGWPETYEVYERLLSLSNVTFVRGNHDQMMLDWAASGEIHPVWLQNGGDATMASYKDGVPAQHLTFLKQSRSYYIREQKLFVHAGILTDVQLVIQNDQTFLWDRSFFKKVINAHFKELNSPFTAFDEIYIGHSPIHRYGLDKPTKAAEVWMMDTGAGWEGYLSMMNVHTKEVFQSDRVDSFYPPGSGRGG